MILCSRQGEVAQLVEHTTENRSVASSILALATILRSPQASFGSQANASIRSQAKRRICSHAKDVD